MKGIRLLLKNAFKTAWRSPSQLIGLSSLVMLVSMISSLLSSTSSRVIDAYEYLNTKSNIRDVVMDIDQSTTRLKKPVGYDLSVESQEVYQQWIMNNLANQYNFSWSRTEGRTFSEVKKGNTSLVIKVLAKTNQNDTKPVDSMIVSKGQNFSSNSEISKRQVIVGESFALANNLKIGDVIRVQKDKYGEQLNVKENKEVADVINKWDSFYKINDSEYFGLNWFEIIGFASSADFVTPLIDSSSAIPNVASEAIFYIDPQLFGLYKLQNSNSNGDIYNFDNRNSALVVSSDSDKETYYSLKFNSSNFNESAINNINSDFKYFSGINKEINFFYLNDDSSYRFYARTATFKTVIEAYNLTATGLLIIILLIAIFTIILITRKQIDNMKRQIGCLKSLGYKKREIVNNFLAAPIIVATIGSIFGYIISIFISGTIVSVFSNYFNIAFTGFTFDPLSLFLSIVGIWLALSITAIIMAYYTIKDTSLNLLKGNADRGISKLGLIIKSNFAIGKFDSKLRMALLTTSLGKLLGVSITMLLGTIMLTTTIVAPKVLKDNMTATFNGLDFENQIEYSQPISSNPLTFYRTYNPNFKSADWGYSDNKFVNSYAGAKQISSTTASPVISSNSEKKEIDVEKIINQISQGDISSKFYTYDIYGEKDGQNNDANPWSVMSYLNWKNLSVDFLKNLDKINIESNFINNIALSTLLNQWTDYGIFVDEVNSAQTSNELAKTLLWFYKKYTSGIAIPYNPSFTKNIDEKEWVNWSWGNETKSAIDKIFTKKSDLWNFTNIESLISEENTNFKPILNDKMAEINFYNLDIKNITIDDWDYVSPITIENLNQALIMWYTAAFQNRLGAVILETAYSRAPYFVQEYLKSAYENDKEYNISFNLVPFDAHTEEIGTYFKAEFDNRNKILEETKIYGITEKTKLLDLKSKNGENLNSKLISENNSENIIPLIINETFAIKSGYKVNDIVNLNVVKEEIVQNENVLTLDDFSQKAEQSQNTNAMKFKDYRTQSSRTYYSNDGNSFVDHTITGINPIKYGNQTIAANGASSSTKTTPIHTSVLNGETYINKNSEDSNKFKIVGIQNGYGKPQGWVLNDDANKIMDYDIVKKWYFENYFLNEWVFLEKFEKVISNYEIIKFLQGYPTYEEFLEKLNSDSENKEELNKVDALFNNLYPVFNYKNSPNSEFLDLTQGFSTSQRYGDYSARGLNGTFQQDTNGQITEYVEGLGVGSLSTMLPLEKTRQILGQITEIVNMTMIMFMVIALVVSITIILLTTGLIIYENKEFIATMKILGYSNKYIVRQILGMYIIPILFTFILGFLAGWFIFVWAIDLLALSTAWVLPVTFAWWIPVTVMLIILGVYTLSFLAGWANIQRINPLEALKVND